MGLGMIHRLIGLMLDVSRDEGVHCTCDDMEQIAVMVHRIMSYQSRQFHTLEHVFGFVGENSDSQTVLAAIFHDLIYYQVDDGIQPMVRDLVLSVVEPSGAGMRLRADLPQSDAMFHLCRKLFGFAEGQLLLPFTGLNEFLSALIFLRLLDGHLPVRELVAVTVCIEASIPFRGVNAAGRGMGEELEWRLRGLAGEGLAELTPDAIGEMVRRAIDFANADVRDFALADAGRFLNNTWKLLPELNAALRWAGTFTIKEYRQAIAKMMGFFKSLLPENIFHEYRGWPGTQDFRRLVDGARRNLAVAESYMQAKLLAISLLESIALVSGKDAPVALFMGDLPGGAEKADTLDMFLPKPELPAWVDPNAAVYHLLKTGRMESSAFDLKNSPLALFLYCRIEPAAWSRLEESCAEYCADRIGPEDYLLSWPAEIRGQVIKACARMVQTRRDVLEAWAQSHP